MLRLFLILLMLLPASPLQAELTLEGGFDGASLNLSASSIDSNQVTLVGRASWTAIGFNQSWRQMSFCLRGANQQRPVFTTSVTEFLGDLAGHHPFLFSYDQDSWQFFDNNSGTESTYTFSHDTAFTNDVVYISYNLPYPVSRSVNQTLQWLQTPWVQPSPLAGFNGVIGAGSGGLTELGEVVPPQPLLAVQLTDPMTDNTDKLRVILVAGVHSGEVYGNWTLEGFVHFLLQTDDPRAAALRRQAVFHIFPAVNADGRYGGFYRSGPEHPDIDYNRVWDNVADFTDLSQIRAAMIADTMGDADMLLDFHNHFNTDGHFFIYSSSPANRLTGTLADFYPGFGVIPVMIRPEVPPPGFLDEWAGHPDGLAAEFVSTIEACPGLERGAYLEFGELIALSLADQLFGLESFVQLDWSPSALRTLRWPGISRRQYRIEWTRDPHAAAGGWSTSPFDQVPGTNGLMSWHPPEETFRWFRLVEMP